MSRHSLRRTDNGCTVIFPQLLQCSGTTSSNVGRTRSGYDHVVVCAIVVAPTWPAPRASPAGYDHVVVCAIVVLSF